MMHSIPFDIGASKPCDIEKRPTNLFAVNSNDFMHHYVYWL